VSTDRPLRASLRLNNDVGVDEFVEIARVAESLGFDQIWVSNDLFFRSAPVLLAAAATATSTIALGTCVLNPYSMHPAEIAMTAATLQELSNGRFLLGIAAGATDFLRWAGIDRPAPLRRTREAIVAIRALSAGRSPADIAGSGPGWEAAAHLRMDATPTPIYLGAMSSRMLELIGEIADGGLPLLYPPESLSAAMERVRAGLDRSGREESDVDVAACIWVSVDDDAVAARRPLAEKLVYFGASFGADVLERVGVDAATLAELRDLELPVAVARLPPAMLTLGVAGTPADVVTRCDALVSAGARHISFGPPLGPERLQAVRLLGEQVVPVLRKRRGPTD
jgi:5,10-methylenetetrahydromethanopterin reductase